MRAMDRRADSRGEAGERSSLDDVLAVYAEGIDRTLLRANLALDPDSRSRKLEAFLRFLEEVRGAARRAP
jgi:hypothetical protein